MRGVLHAIGGVISAAVVLAAFWAAVRLLAGRAFRRTAYPRRLLGPRRRGAVTLRPARLIGRVMVLALRFAAGAPLGKRRTDATFLSRGTHVVGGVPGWFTTGQLGRWAWLPGWQRAAVRWAAVAAAIGLYAWPLITGAVLGGLAVAAGAALAAHWRRARWGGRWSALSTCSCAAISAPTPPRARSAGWMSRAGSPPARTLWSR